jgi:hypothetical protein
MPRWDYTCVDLDIDKIFRKFRGSKADVTKLPNGVKDMKLGVHQAVQDSGRTLTWEVQENEPATEHGRKLQ